ncbi:hypothetical protein BG011_003816 [Mortierella polycephala]|uniref:glutathione gamma-glutamylcysteinyltransferase n=1 Tax=Mortierella polycephala TaxID=41804 RepID=A0A9P6QH89_9FUNG|nr:hypothetical protein BG011_003816 [Mortierella polycephala]
MAFDHQDDLTNITVLRSPSRRNRFSLLAKALIGSETVLLHQARYEGGHGLRKDIDRWLEVLTPKVHAQKESHLLLVKGTLDLSAFSSIMPSFLPGSVASSYNLNRPIHVVEYFERGSLRDSLDRGEFSSRTAGGAGSNWSAKMTVLKDVAAALRFIQNHMHGQQHGALSSSSIFVDQDGRAYLSWHDPKATRLDFTMGRSDHWRWFSPTNLLALRSWLDQEGNPLEVQDIDPDDMYSFGILAWEVATEELPLESVDLPSSLRLSDDIERRFARAASPPLQRIIQHCLEPAKRSRLSWDDLLSELESIDPQSMETPHSIGDDSPKRSNASPALLDSTQYAVPGGPIPSDKSMVVKMMESVLDSTFYRRDLPEHLDSFTSDTGKRLFREIILAGTGECFFKLCTSFNTQSDPAFCGVSSLSMVLNALGIDPRKQWRGVWRWYSDEQLDCCASIEVMKQKGITFNQFNCLARCHAKVIAKRADRYTIQEFRRDIQAVSCSDESHMVLSFSRAALGQTGSGHFSPIGGYHEPEDKVLVLDTARFKYPPFYATVTELWESLLPQDPETGVCRGYFLISATAKQKLDMQRKLLRTSLDGNSQELASSGNSSSVSLPTLADVKENVVDSSLAMENQDECVECDCVSSPQHHSRK